MGCTKYLPYPAHLADTLGLSQEEPQHQQRARSLMCLSESCEAHAIGLRECSVGSYPVPGSAPGVAGAGGGKAV